MLTFRKFSKEVILKGLLITGAFSLIFLSSRIILAADGSGSNIVSPNSALRSSTGNTFNFTFTAAESMNSGGITITVPAGWSSPQGTSGVAGYTTLTTTGLIATAKDNADSTSGWSAGTACSNGFAADTTTKHEGTASLRCSNGGESNGDVWYKNISSENWSSYTNVGFWIHSTVGIANGHLTFAYSSSANLGATGRTAISIGVVPANTWTYVNLSLSGTRTAIVSFGFRIANNNGVDNRIVRADDFLLGPGVATFPGGGVINARVLSLASGGTISVSYGSGGGTSGATAPSTVGVYTFTTQSRSSDSGILTSIGSSPTITVNNPVPTTTSINPTSKTAGDSGFVLTVNGTNFVSDSVVNFNGSARTTTYISSTQLTANILTSDLTSAGTFPITVTNSTPGGGTSYYYSLGFWLRSLVL